MYYVEFFLFFNKKFIPEVNLNNLKLIDSLKTEFLYLVEVSLFILKYIEEHKIVQNRHFDTFEFWGWVGGGHNPSFKVIFVFFCFL